jgi:hypothetical protein
MAPIRWSSLPGAPLSRALLGGFLALALTAAPAAAELSSVDAYGGQAQVLGKPVHRHVKAGGSGTQGAGGGSDRSAGASGSQTAGGGSSETSAGSGSHTGGGANATTPATTGAVNGASSQTAGGGTGGRSAGGNGGAAGGAGSSMSAGGTSGAAGGGQSPPVALADSAAVSDGSLSLSSLDVFLLIVLCAGLVGVGVLLRRWSRQAR